MSELEAVMQKLQSRQITLRAFTHPTGCHEDQKHLDAGSSERTYWHYGYLVAIGDILNLLAKVEKSNV